MNRKLVFMLFFTLVILLLVIFGISKRFQPSTDTTLITPESVLPNQIIYTYDTSLDTAPYEADCKEKGGEFDACGSPCAPDNEVCVQVCAYTCELPLEKPEPVDSVSDANIKEYQFELYNSESKTMPFMYIIKGKISGRWFFEGSFPLYLVDVSNGNTIASAIAQAQGEWMTENAVEFVADFGPFVWPNGGKGELVFKKDNPSGDPANDAQIRIPVTFPKSDAMPVLVFFADAKAISEGSDCSAVLEFNRIVEKNVAVGKTSLLQLLLGPTPRESGLGAVANIPSEVKLNTIIIDNGTANVDFNSALNEKTAGSCMVTSIRSQIEKTLKQFPTVKNVVISVEGETTDVLQP